MVELLESGADAATAATTGGVANTHSLLRTTLQSADAPGLEPALRRSAWHVKQLWNAALELLPPKREHWAAAVEQMARLLTAFDEANGVCSKPFAAC